MGVVEVAQFLFAAARAAAGSAGRRPPVGNKAGTGLAAAASTSPAEAAAAVEVAHAAGVADAVGAADVAMATPSPRTRRRWMMILTHTS